MEFQVLGPLLVVNGSHTVELRAAKQRVLLAVLLCCANIPVSMNRLLDSLWGDDPPRTAAENVRLYVYQLRRALGDGERIVRGPLGYALLVRPEELDVTRFEQLAEQGQKALLAGEMARAARLLREALTVWRGRPYADLDHVPMLLAEADRLQERRMTVLEARIEADLALGHHHDLAAELSGLVARHPLRERLRGQLMLSLYRAGRQADALAAYRDGRRILATELGLEPGPELRDLERWILTGDPSLAPPAGQPAVTYGIPYIDQRVVPAPTPDVLGRVSRRVSSPVMVGREPELAVLAAAWSRVEQGHGGFVLVEGEAGVGKSRLLAEFVRHAADRGATVLSGECLPFAEAVPYSPVADIVHRLNADDRPADAPSAGSDPGDRMRYFQRVTDRLLALATGCPVLVVLEDLHWIDESTGDLVLFLAQRVRRHRVLLVGSRRDDEPAASMGAAWGELVRSGRAERVRLDRLDREHVIELLRGMLGEAPPDDLVRRVTVRAEGNPFFCEELVAAGGGDELPVTVREVILARLDRVRPATLRLLGAVAVAGRRVAHPMLESVADIDQAELGSALRDALTHGLLVVSGDRYVFRHALGQEAVYGELLPGERTALHQRVATALARRTGRSPHVPSAVAAAELAHHWTAAGQWPQALSALVAAGRAAEAGHAPAAAYRHYRRALDLWHQVDAAKRSDVDDRWLLERAAEMASFVGNYADAASLNATLVAELDPDQDEESYALALERQRRYLWYGGELDAARDIARELAGRVPRTPSTATAHVMCGIANQAMVDRRYLSALTAAERALAVARAVGARLEEAWALGVLGTAKSALGAHDEAISLLHRALALAKETSHSVRVALTWYGLIAAYQVADRPTEALRLARTAIAEARALGLDRTEVPALDSLVINSLIPLGRWQEADRASAAAVSEEIAPFDSVRSKLRRAQLLIGRGRFASAATLLDSLAPILDTSREAHQSGLLARCQAELAAQQADWGAARAAVRAGLALNAPTDSPQDVLKLLVVAARVEADAYLSARRTAPPADLEAIRAACAAHAGQAEEFLAQIERATGYHSAPFHLLLDRIRAERSRLDDPPNAELWSDIADRSGHDRQLTAYARWRQAEAFLTSPDPTARTQAETAMRDAQAIAAALGAQPLLDALSELARRTGIPLEPAGDRA